MIGYQRSLSGIIQRRHLGQRQIFGEALGREIFGCATQDGEKSSACGVGTAGAAIEVGGNVGPGKSMLQQAYVLLGRTNDDRYLVEANPAIGFLQNPARDLDALTPFAGS